MTDQSAELAKLREQVERLQEFERQFNHAIECVDRVFQERSDRPPPLLPDFCGLGDDKFESVILLAEAFIAKCEQVAHQTKCIAAQSDTCAKYAKRLDEAVGLLRRWRNCESQIGPLDMTLGPNARMLEETTAFLAAIDAEAKTKEAKR